MRSSLSRAALLGIVLLSAFWSVTANAADPKLLQCIAAAAKYRNLDPDLLMAISWQESDFRLNAVNKNVDKKTNKVKSIDYGPFQINSGWLPKLEKFGITQKDLHDPCVAPYVAAWIMANNIKDHGSTWRAVGAYNAKKDDKRQIYVNHVRKKYILLKRGYRPWT